MEFIKNAYQAYAGITFLDMLLSSPLLLIAKLFLYFLCALIVSFSIGMRGVKGGGFLLVFFLLMGVAIFFGLRTYKKFETQTPIRQKVFTYRIAQFLDYLKPASVESTNGRIFASLSGASHPIEIRYDKNLVINTGGTVGGVALALPKRAHPKTFFFVLTGSCHSFQESIVNVDFSARTDDEDKIFGYGVREYRLEKRLLAGYEHVAVSQSSPEVKAFMARLCSSIEGTGLKGEIEFDHGRFQLTVFDPVEKITPSRGKITYRRYRVHDSLKNIQEPQLSVYGIERVLELVKVS